MPIPRRAIAVPRARAASRYFTSTDPLDPANTQTRIMAFLYQNSCHKKALRTARRRPIGGAWQGGDMTITRRELLAGAALLPAARALARKAVQIAEANAALERRPVQRAPEPPYYDSWETPIEKDPLRVPVKTKVALLVEAAKAAKAAVPQVRAVMGFFRLAIEEKAFFSSEGSAIEQMITRTGGGY